MCLMILSFTFVPYTQHQKLFNKTTCFSTYLPLQGVSKKVIQLWHVIVCVNYWVPQLLNGNVFVSFNQSGTTIRTIKIVGQNHIFSPLYLIITAVINAQWHAKVGLPLFIHPV